MGGAQCVRGKNCSFESQSAVCISEIQTQGNLKEKLKKISIVCQNSLSNGKQSSY